MLVRLPNKSKSTSNVNGKWNDRRIQAEYLILILDNLHRFNSFNKLADWIVETQHVSPKKSTLADWYLHYRRNHELPAETKEFYEKLMKRKSCNLPGNEFTKKWTKSTVGVLRKILADHPEFYLDEFVEELFCRTGILYHPSTVWRLLKKRLGYSLKVYAPIAKQRNEYIRTKYKSAINRLVKHIEQCLFIDESSKNRNASRRNKAWGRKGENLELNQWFSDEYNYTLIAACNYKGKRDHLELNQWLSDEYNYSLLDVII